MKHVRLAAVFALSAVVVACGNEIPTQPDPLVSVAPPAEPSAFPLEAVDAGGLRPGQKNKTPTDAGAVIIPVDGSILEAACVGVPELEPNDEDNKDALGTSLCGSLTAGDIDAFAAQSQSQATTLHFTTTGDAILQLKGYGQTRTLKNGESLEVPSFPIQLGFTVVVSSPTATAQSYHITFE